MANQRHIFRRGPVSLGGLAVFVFLGLVLIFINTFTNLLSPARAFFVDLIAPFYQVTDVASSLSEWGEDSLISRDELLAERKRLKDENLILQSKVMSMASLQAENARMRQLLSASEFVDERVLIAELVGTPPDTETHRLIIDRGRIDGVAIGQPVIDAQGIFGQVAIAGNETSEIILVSDREHALPVQVLRNGARAVAEGTGDYKSLRLRNVPPTMDIEVGDQMVSSGLGQRFPRGYPVGRVTSVDYNSSSPFMEIGIEPSAGLRTSRQLLLLFSVRDDSERRAAEGAEQDQSSPEATADQSSRGNQ